MAFGDFTFPQVKDDLDLTIEDVDLYFDVPAISLREEFASMIAEGATLALAINTEKARSEFIIAPILLELRRRLGRDFSLFSGVELNVEPSKGLNGVCDFILSGSPHQSILTAPLVTIVEAKNDNPRNGLGQCIASMVAAHLFNQKAGNPVTVVHGVATTGNSWKFLKLMDKAVTLDLKEYYIDDPGKILGILQSLLQTAPIALTPRSAPSPAR
jgi:hypothetical protein